MIKRLLATGALTASLVLGIAGPVSTASATPNGSQLENCIRRAASHLESHPDSSSARQKFSRDVARCHRRFG